ncbi:MAG: hypothetical protein VKK43_11290 [Synechococcaceae cyanobacterium]|nr:hypothetical protein [Synechococcaceae cyanobacterium]
MSESPPRARGVSARFLRPPRGLFAGLWLLSLVGLLARVLRQPTIAGTYDVKLDEFLYAGQRLLQGELLYAGLVNGSLPLVQWLYAPSAWLGGLTAHRLLILAVNLVGGALLVGALRQLSTAGLVALRPNSRVPWAAATTFVVGGQMLPGGMSGHPHQFANTFLVLALYAASRALAPAPGRGERLGGRRRLALAASGAALVLALECFVRLSSPLLMVALLALVLLQVPRPLAVLAPLLGGAVAMALLSVAPYAALPQGGALLWAGAVQLPLEVASGYPAEGNRLLPLLAKFLSTPMAGLPIWLIVLVPCLGLVDLAARERREPGRHGERLLLLPGLAVIFVLEVLLSFQRGDFETRDMQLLVLPLVLILACGFAEMERSGRRWIRGCGLLALLLMTLIFFNNTVVSPLSHAPRRPRAPVRALEADRSLARRYLAALPAGERGFTAPQDVALQRQLRERASTVGIGPEWSLNQQQLAPSWATRRLGLPTDTAASCNQLTAPANRHLVWMRTDPSGPNTEAFLRACLAREPGQWQEISDRLGLRSGKYRLFRRLPTQPP